MATNWNVKQAHAAIIEGNKEAIIDLGKRFPLTLATLARIEAGNPAINLINALPEHVTVRKIEQILKDGVQETEDEIEATEEAAANEPTVESETEEDETEAANDYSKMNRKQLRDLIRDAGGEKKCREEFGWAKREQMLAYIEKYGVDPVEEEAVEEDPYEGKNAIELFKECKKRGIKAAPKKPAKFYIDLLKKADEAKTASTEEDEDEDWGEEEEEAKPAKPVKKEKKAAKPAKKDETEDEDEDEWDI